jgi:tetratricopeptide (TPR) repeat protein
MQEHAPTGLKLDIACGQRKSPGFCGVDIWEGADIICNLEQFPWPFADDSVDEIFCSHYIEHVPDLVSFANELHRIMKVGAKAVITAPYYSSIRAWQDPTHVRPISENTFLYFNSQWRLLNKLDHYPIVSDFDFQVFIVYNPDWEGKPDEELRFAAKHYINVIDDIRVILTKRPSLAEGPVHWSRLAYECWDEGRLEEAVACCRELVGIGAATAEIHLMIADFALRQERYDTALVSFRDALALEGTSLQAHAGVLRSLIGLGRNQEAAQYLVSVREQDPEGAEMLDLLVEGFPSAAEAGDA